MIPPEVLRALGEVTVQSAHLDWLRAGTHYLLDPDEDRPIDHRLGLARDRMTKQLRRFAVTLEPSLRTAIQAWASDGERLLAERDERVHAYWIASPERGALTFLWRHRSGGSGLADADELTELAARIGGCGARIVEVQQRLADSLRTGESS